MPLDTFAIPQTGARAPLIDDGALRDLLEEVGLDLFLAFAARMRASAQIHLEALERPEEAPRASHALCGLLGHFGLMRAAELARAIQPLPPADPQAPPLVAALKAALADSLAQLPDRARALAAPAGAK